MPEEVGGAGLDTLTWVLYEKELGRANYALHWNCVARPSNILMACNEEQRERYTYPCVRGEKIDCMAMTEPGAGSDLRGMKATAVRMAMTGCSTAPSTSSPMLMKPTS
jgi:acyl-CoA dehydrogenase